MKKGNETGQVGRVEDYDNMLYIRAIRLYILAELLGDLAVALEKVLSGHSLFAGSSAGRNDIFRVFVCLLDIRSVGNVGAIECTMIHFLGNPFQPLCIRIIQTEVRSKSHHHSGLCHV